MKTTGRIGILSMLGIAASCSGPPVVGEEGDLGTIDSALSTPSPLSFDDPSTWRGPGTLTTNTTVRTEGAASLAVTPNNYSLYESVPFEFSGRARTILLDLQLPTTQPNPWWYGAVQLYVESPSANLYNAWIGQVELTGRPLGTFNSLSFAVPSWVADRLAGGTKDLKIRIALNVPGAPGVYLLDNLRIQTELVLHYRFDQVGAGNTVVDSSGYGRHGWLRGGAALSPNGRAGSALDLNGADAYVDVPDGVTENLNEITVAAWVNLARLDPWSRIFDFGGSNGFAYFTPTMGNGQMRFSAYAGFGNESIVTAPSVPVNAWKHVAITSSGKDYRVYLDGVEAGSVQSIPVSLASIGTNAGFGNWIGRSRFPDPLLAGRIDDFRIYDRVLSRREISALAAPGSDYANWRFDEESGTTASDASSLARSGTLHGAASFTQGVIDRALQLSGGNVSLPPGIVQSCTDLTVATWVNLASNAPWNRVFDFGKPDFSSFMYLSTAGFGAAGQELRFALVSPAGAHDVGFPFVMPLHEWNHLAVVLRGDTAKLFLNGRAVTTQGGVVANPSDMGTTTGNYVGRSTFPADAPFDGKIDDLRVSCRAYEDTEIAALAHLPAPATFPAQVPVSGAITDVHDPSMIAAGGKHYLFSTGPRLMIRTSDDLSSWTFAGHVFEQNPAWVTQKFGALDSLWAPDISYFGGTYHLYYSASTFGNNRSCIGHATKGDLSSSEPWTDRGPVICSNDGSAEFEDWNAIDPNVIVDQQGTPWMSFGSFWGGIKMIKLDASGARADGQLIGIAQTPSTFNEAPYIVYRAPYYYLFTSWDFCCRGSDSSYHVVVGRSTSPSGPFLDRTGLDMRFGGGTPVVDGNARWRGPGHNAIFKRDGEYFNVYHAYDAVNGGIPTLRISHLTWQEGWPLNAEP